MYGTLPQPDYTNVCFGLQYLNRPAEVAKTLENLCRFGFDECYQIIVSGRSNPGPIGTRQPCPPGAGFSFSEIVYDHRPQGIGDGRTDRRRRQQGRRSRTHAASLEGG